MESTFDSIHAKNALRSVVTIELKGVHEVHSKGRVYYYAWRGGPRIKAKPGTPAFQKAYHEAIEGLKTTGDDSKFKSVVAAYKASPDYLKLAKSTKRKLVAMLG